MRMCQQGGEVVELAVEQNFNVLEPGSGRRRDVLLQFVYGARHVAHAMYAVANIWAKQSVTR
jgi:hypothetical protein